MDPLRQTDLEGCANDSAGVGNIGFEDWHDLGDVTRAGLCVRNTGGESTGQQEDGSGADD